MSPRGQRVILGRQKILFRLSIEHRYIYSIQTDIQYINFHAGREIRKKVT